LTTQDTETLANQDSPAGERGQGIELREYWRIAYRRRALLVSVAVLALLFSLVDALLTPPTYQARSLLEIEKEAPGAMDFSQPSAALFNADPEFYQTQYVLLKSRGLAERVVTRLRLADRLEFNPSRAGLWKGASAAAPPSQLLSGLAMRLQKMTTVSPTRGTHLVAIEVVARTPPLAADLANGLADTFIDWKVEQRLAQASQASRFLAMEAEQLKGELDEKKRQLAAYGATSNIISPEAQGNLTMQKLESISKDYGSALADRITKEARYSEVRTAPPEAIADTLSNGLVTQIRANQSKLEGEYAQKLNIFKPEWPAMQELDAQIAKGREHLKSVVSETVAKARETARVDYQAALQREQSLQAVLNQQKQQTLDQAPQSAEYNNLRMDVQTKQTLLDTLLKRQSETSIDSQLTDKRNPAIVIVDRAIVPLRRYRPSYLRSGGLGVFLGLVLGLGLVFLLDHLDRSLKTPEDVEHWVGIATLGVIPAIGESVGRGYGYGYLSSRRRPGSGAGGGADGSVDAGIKIELIPVARPHSGAAEAYRALRTTLMTSSAEKLQTLVVTSALPGEGKTATSVNLAVVFAQLGKRVILIDADLRKPRVHEIFGLSRRVGLASFLSGQNAEIGYQTKIPNLSVIGTGPFTPNPLELLASARMAELMSMVRANFELVIIDTAPMLLVSDAVVASKLADGVILCVHAGKTPREIVRQSSDRLRLAGVRHCGVVLNNLSARLATDPYYREAGYSGGYSGYFSEAAIAQAGLDAAPAAAPRAGRASEAGTRPRG